VYLIVKLMRFVIILIKLLCMYVCMYVCKTSFNVAVWHSNGKLM